MPEEEKLTALMTATAQDPPPSQIVDIEHAITAGRRGRRRRQFLVAAGAVATVVAMTAGVAVAVSGQPAHHTAAPPATSSPVEPSSTSTVAPPGVPAAFDPRRNPLRTGWLPPTFDGRVLRIAANQVDLQVFPSEPTGGNSAVAIALAPVGGKVSLWATSVPYQDPPITGTVFPDDLRPDAWPPTGTPGPDINGSASFWSPNQGILAWQWAPQAWAAVNGGGPALGSNASEVREAIVHIARTLSVDAGEPVTLPFRMSKPSPPLALLTTEVIYHATEWLSSTLEFSDRPDEVDSSGHVTPLLAVSVSTDADGPSKLPPNATVDGRPVIIQFTPRDGIVQFPNVDGYRISVQVNTEAGLRYVDQSVATAMARDVHVVDGAADRSRWIPIPF